MTEGMRVYRLGEVRAELDLSEAAARGWLVAFERVTGAPLPREPGTKSNAARLVPQDALEAIRRARAESAAHPGRVTADDALRRALGLEAAPLTPSGEGQGAADVLEALESIRSVLARSSDRAAELVPALERLAPLVDRLERLAPTLECLERLGPALELVEGRALALPAPTPPETVREAVRAELGEWEAATGSDEAVRAAVAPLVEELQALRTEVAGLREPQKPETPDVSGYAGHGEKAEVPKPIGVFEMVDLALRGFFRRRR